jgi:hypothetical protein
MNRYSKWWLALASGVVLTGVLGAGAVMAQTPVPGTGTTGTTFLARVAGKLGIDTPALETAVKSAKSDEIDARVASGNLTQAQADQLKQQIANAPADAPLFGGGPGDHGRGPGPGGFGDPANIAGFLGITTDQFHTEIEASGATLANVAQAHGKSRDQLKAFLTDDAKTRLAQDVTDGRLTQTQADARLADITSNLDARIDGAGRPDHGFGGPGGGPGDMPQAPGSTAVPGAANNG